MTNNTWKILNLIIHRKFLNNVCIAKVKKKVKSIWFEIGGHMKKSIQLNIPSK
jgi:hypothetical protein